MHILIRIKTSPYLSNAHACNAKGTPLCGSRTPLAQWQEQEALALPADACEGCRRLLDRPRTAHVGGACPICNVPLWKHARCGRCQILLGERHVAGAHCRYCRRELRGQGYAKESSS
jgi:hypothetical protein